MSRSYMDWLCDLGSFPRSCCDPVRHGEAGRSGSHEPGPLTRHWPLGGRSWTMILLWSSAEDSCCAMDRPVLGAWGRGHPGLRPCATQARSPRSSTNLSVPYTRQNVKAQSNDCSGFSGES